MVNRFLATRSSIHKANQEDGQGLAEFGLILALVAVVCIGALTALGEGILSSPGWSVFS